MHGLVDLKVHADANLDTRHENGRKIGDTWGSLLVRFLEESFTIMLRAKEEYTEARVQGSQQMENLFFYERKFELWVHVVAFVIIIAITQYFYPAFTVPIVVAWVGVSINSKLIAVYYIIKQIGNIHTGYYEELRNIGREILADKTKKSEGKKV